MFKLPVIFATGFKDPEKNYRGKVYNPGDGHLSRIKILQSIQP